jgi:hypothetical protein
VIFGIAQAGLALLLAEPLTRWMCGPVAWAAATTNASAMTLFLWHPTAFLAVTMAGPVLGRLPGLLTDPSSALWVAERLAWLPRLPPRSAPWGWCSTGANAGRAAAAGASPGQGRAPRQAGRDL